MFGYSLGLKNFPNFEDIVPLLEAPSAEIALLRLFKLVLGGAIDLLKNLS